MTVFVRVAALQAIFFEEGLWLAALQRVININEILKKDIFLSILGNFKHPVRESK